MIASISSLVFTPALSHRQPTADGPAPSAQRPAPTACYTRVVKKICDTILDAIGDTPLVRINRITQGVIAGDRLAKIETFNPGNSIKDRMAVKMIEDAEKRRAAEARRHDHRGHLGQHRHGPGHRRRHQGLQVRLHDDRQAVEGEGRTR